MSLTTIEHSPTVSTTEYSLVNNSTTIATSTTQCMMQAFVDLNAMAAGDVFRLRVYEKTVSGGTQRVIYDRTYQGVLSQPIVVTPALVLANGWDVTLLKLSGTDRAIPYSVRQLSL
jgi:hypothetical protein